MNLYACKLKTDNGHQGLAVVAADSSEAVREMFESLQSDLESGGHYCGQFIDCAGKERYVPEEFLDPECIRNIVLIGLAKPDRDYRGVVAYGGYGA